jgi:hypothetical protein
MNSHVGRIGADGEGFCDRLDDRAIHRVTLSHLTVSGTSPADEAAGFGLHGCVLITMESTNTDQYPLSCPYLWDIRVHP